MVTNFFRCIFFTIFVVNSILGKRVRVVCKKRIAINIVDHKKKKNKVPGFFNNERKAFNNLLVLNNFLIIILSNGCCVICIIVKYKKL